MENNSSFIQVKNSDAPIEKESQELIAQEEKIIIMNAPEEENVRPSSVTIFGSNNIMGHNIFLVNTSAEEKDLEKLISSLPAEFLDKFIAAMGNVIQKQNSQNSNGTDKDK